MQGFLVLESGETYPGVWFGEPQFAKAGEVVFNTSHSGYEEIATDPSYFSQIVVMTAPMQGNYGADHAVWESRQIFIQAFICLQMDTQKLPHTWAGTLKAHQVPILTEIDTRALTLRLRDGGTTWGAAVVAANKEDAVKKAKELILAKKKEDLDWVWATSRKKVEKIKGANPKGPKVAILDFGAKENILRELSLRCSELLVFPSRAPLDSLLAENPDGLMLTNGPGNPEDVHVAPDTVRALIGRLPIFGICMGHQILALALGAQTYKMKFGHRGSNHPVRDEILGKVYITSQNHGYAVVAKTLPADVKVTHWNLNDQSVAGFYSAERSCLGIQYHPESHPGPHEGAGLFDFFVSEMLGKAKPKKAELTV